MASSKPPPNAKPLTAAITGVDKFSIKSKRFFCPLAANFFPSFTEKSENSEISAPATNAFSPLPVNIIAFIFLSFCNSLKTSCNSPMVFLFSAFNLFGRLIVTIAVDATFSIKIVSYDIVVVFVFLYIFFRELYTKHGPFTRLRCKFNSPFICFHDILDHT